MCVEYCAIAFLLLTDSPNVLFSKARPGKNICGFCGQFAVQLGPTYSRVSFAKFPGDHYKIMPQVSFAKNPRGNDNK